jgi:hypothetical protein
LTVFFPQISPRGGVGGFLDRGIKEAREHTDDPSRTSPMKIKKTECKLLQEERKRDGERGRREKEGRVEEGREKWERKKRDEKVGTFSRSAPPAGIFCAFLITTPIPSIQRDTIYYIRSILH